MERIMINELETKEDYIEALSALQDVLSNTTQTLEYYRSYAQLLEKQLDIIKAVVNA